VILGKSVALLNLTFEPVSPPIDHSEVIISELAPLIFDLASEPLPVSLNGLPIHSIPSPREALANRETFNDFMAVVRRNKIFSKAQRGQELSAELEQRLVMAREIRVVIVKQEAAHSPAREREIAEASIPVGESVALFAC
jgi:hypothetical protein